MKRYKVWLVVEEETIEGEIHRDLKETQQSVGGSFKTLKGAINTIDKIVKEFDNISN